MRIWYLGMLAALTLLAGCGHTPVVSGFDQDSARAFILGKVGNQVPTGVRLEKHYKENFTTTTDTQFTCNRSDRLERVTNYTITRVEGNYLEISASHIEDCDAGVTRYRLNGWYNRQYVYLRTADKPTTYVYVMEISQGGSVWTDIGNYRYVDGQLKWQNHVRNGDKRGNGGYYFTTGYVAQGDTSEASAEQRDVLARSQQAKRNEPSTASQVALFSSLMASQMNQQTAARAAELAAAQERQRQLRVAEADTARRNQQLLAAAAASRQPSSRDTTASSGTGTSVASTTLAASTATATASAAAQERAAREKRAEDERRRAEKIAADKAAAEQAAAEKAAAEKAAAEKAAANKAAAEARKAQQEADKKAQAEAKARAEADYLQQLGGKTRLTAKNCYGEQHAMGLLPSIKPQVVSCVDMHFRAYCPGTAPSQAYQGAIKNMVGMGTGCFGDTAQITPKLGCKAEEIRVEVVRAAPCS